MTNKKATIVGSGGIGSFFIEHINRLIKSEQIKGWDFTVVDDDVVEDKNILYQNFKPFDAGKKKVDAMRMRFPGLKFEPIRVSSNEISKVDLLIICADNNIIRREAWKNYEENNIPFIDSRSNGRSVGIYSSDLDNYSSTLSEDNDSHSCQHPFQLEKKEIELGNVVIASILASATLNYTRHGNLPPKFEHLF